VASKHLPSTCFCQLYLLHQIVLLSLLLLQLLLLQQPVAWLQPLSYPLMVVSNQPCIRSTLLSRAAGCCGERDGHCQCEHHQVHDQHHRAGNGGVAGVSAFCLGAQGQQCPDQPAWREHPPAARQCKEDGRTSQ